MIPNAVKVVLAVQVFNNLNKKKMINFINEAKEIFEKVSSIRRHIHQNPELSFQEFETTNFICKILAENNIEFQRITETGVVALIGNSGKCIALRADIDALPIVEETGLEYASNCNGVMHACGHDMHTSMLLGAAILLKKNENLLNGKVKLIFQPGEEKLPGGAKLMIDAGVLNNPTVDAVFGQHIHPQDESGKIAIAAGPIMASTDELYLTIKGKGAHAAQPHLGNDIILTASQLINQFQTIITKFKNPLQPAVLSITSIHAGNTTNIFPEELKMMGTMRTFNAEVRSLIKEKLKIICENYAVLTSTEIILDIAEGYPTLINDTNAAEFVRTTAVELLSNENVIAFEPKMWAEDFAYFAQNVPSVFWFLGVKPDGIEQMPALHNPKLNPDENAMIHGTAMLVKVAIDYLDR